MASDFPNTQQRNRGDPPIYLHDIFDPDELAVDPFNLDDEELEIVIRRLSETLLG